MSELLSTLDASSSLDRRTLLRNAGLGGASLVMGNLLAGCGGHNNSSSSSSSGGPSDLDILNFALNLEYLEGSYYTIGTGQYTLTSGQLSGTASGSNPTAGGIVNGGAQVSLPTYGGYFTEIAADESRHITALRTLITQRGGTPVARPNIDFVTAFATAGAAAGNPSFNPFGSEADFLLGAFLLSDVGVTAYVGGSQYLSNQTVKLMAAQILAAEAYHVGSIRTLIFTAGATTIANSQAIASARNTLNAGLTPVINDQGVGLGSDPDVPSAPNIALTDSNGLVFGRSTNEVLAEVYLAKASSTASGGFFPNGVNGTIRSV